ncbi:DUF2972 domain-containing protein, partial [Helicobacter trogontum]|uniref:DUF2972 domain-containing protein n=1 Tax=Helicobacter trogontum TaxID=50960 RepID=UPI001F2485CF
YPPPPPNNYSECEYETQYFPLLNPTLFNYSATQSSIAYHYNMPLPRYYNFIYMATYGAGYQAMKRFFEYCNVCVAELWTEGIDSQQEYEHFYNTLVNNREKYCIIYLSGRNLYGREKLFCLIDAHVPLLIIARDPISIYRPIVNHLGEREYQYTCTLQTDYRVFLDSIRYYLDPTAPSLDILASEESCSEHGVTALSIQSRAKALKHVSKIQYIAFDEILEMQAFDTFKRLAKEYGFKPPKQKEIFEAKVNGGMLLGLLPRALIINECDVPFMFGVQKDENSVINNSQTNNQTQAQYEIIITTPQIQTLNDCIDISKDLDIDIPFPNIYLLMTKDSFIKFQTHQELVIATRKYLQGFLKELENRAHIENNKRLDENDILERFRQDTALAMKYKKIFDKELAHIKENRPDIVATWGYYQEFEKICKNA